MAGWVGHVGWLIAYALPTKWSVVTRGVATGVDIGIYTPPPKKKKSAQVNFLWGKMTSEQLFNSFIHPKNFYTPQKKFLATPLVVTRPAVSLAQDRESSPAV